MSTFLRSFFSSLSLRRDRFVKVSAFALVAVVLSACSNTPEPFLNAENKKVVFIQQIDFVYPSTTGSKIAYNIEQAVHQLSLSWRPQFVSPVRASHVPSIISVVWSRVDDRAFARGYEGVPYTPWLGENLLAGEWVYYNPDAQDKTKMFVPCNNRCGPQKVPTLFALQTKEKHLHKMKEEKRYTKYLIKADEIRSRKASDNWLAVLLELSDKHRTERYAREDALQERLKQIEADYNRTNK